jgi:flagellar basal-body rod modification protein FlgD
MAVQAVSSNAVAGSSGSTTSSQNSLDGMDTTFMNLLITELQSQDPTSPMDPTAMVGQMISLNQLDQLIAIHQILQPTNNLGSTTATNGGH